MATDIMTIDELAEYLKLSKSTIYSKVYNGRIPFFRAGDADQKHAPIRFLKHDIDLWIAERKQGGLPGTKE